LTTSRASAGAFAADAPAVETRPNIVYILCDDLGYGDVHALNAEAKVATPNIDSLARDGMTFTDAHSGSAVCTPTRYGILTGRYAFRTRLKKGVLMGYDEPLIDAGRMTVASLLREKGYATACVGKWHLGLGWQTKEKGQKAALETTDFTKPLTAGPHTVGFDYSFIIPASLDMDPYVYIEDGKVTEQPTKKIPASPRPALWRGGWIAPSFTHETTLLTLTQKAVAYLDKRGQPTSGSSGTVKPFFLYLPLTSPHTPHVPRPEFKGKSGAGNYGDFVQETDWAVGQVLDALKRAHLDGQTLVILTSDNGAHAQPVLKEANGHQPSGIFRGQKSDAWEGGHHIPFIARWPGVTPSGSKCNQTICLGDLLATAADLAKAQLPNDAGEDSVSFLPLLRGKVDQPTREALIHHSIDGAFAIRQGKWKLIEAKGSGGWSLPAAKAANQKDLPDIQLYDMQADIREQKNVQAEHPEVVKQLKALLQKYQDEGRSVPKRP
jgi:arylsulfatase A-like enzyme